ncbi:MAG: hypothetical protein EZS28_035433, partial [Streblomastix strix]
TAAHEQSLNKNGGGCIGGSGI